MLPLCLASAAICVINEIPGVLGDARQPVFPREPERYSMAPGFPGFVPVAAAVIVLVRSGGSPAGVASMFSGPQPRSSS
jgi:hypothetical protein